MTTVIDRAHFTDPTPRAIAAELARLITAGDLAAGERLPTVREVAGRLGVSPATVSAAWKALSQAGLIVSRGRAGSFVREERQEWMSPRVQGLAQHPGSPRLDLSGGTPDADLLPDLARAFSRVSPRAHTGRYHESPVLPELETLLRRVWPSDAEAITVVDGALDGVGRALEQVVRFGDRVVVENPGFPYFFDLIEHLGAQPIPVELDAEGIAPSSFARALATRPTAVLLQPRAHNPTGVSTSPERAAELARLVRASRNGARVVIIEDDHSGLVAAAPEVTLARWLPEQVVHVRSFSKSHGPDLRIAALGGPSRIVDRVVARRLLGPGWTSRTIQAVLFDLLSDPVSIEAVVRARESYRTRQRELAGALRRHGVSAVAGDGLNVSWDVSDERAALLHLAAAGIGVAAGAPFFLSDRTARPLIRVTVGLVSGDVDAVAASLARAVRVTG